VTAPFGVYVHVPFCRHRCDYCAFATWTDRDELIDRYVDACQRQIERDRAGRLPPVTSVFFGGGTPSRLPPEQLVGVLAAIAPESDAEVTVECNPDDASVERFAAYRAGGVNRLSFGVQSTAAHVLRALGRTHDPANVVAAADAAHEAGIPFSVDLIHGAPGETLDDWRRTLDDVIGLDPVHVSAYALTVEPGTPLAKDPSRHPDDDDQADKYELAVERLEAAGFAWYELSNWARPGHEARHNLLYWTIGDYLAVGCAAHGHRDGRRYWHVRTPDRYVSLIEAGASVEAGSERLDADQRRIEALQLALRTRDGVPASSFTDADRAGPLAPLLEPAARPGNVRLTVPGRLLANEVALRLR
jgi:oxygen-independent coproporphyrinogen-3 oxidase